MPNKSPLKDSITRVITITKYVTKMFPTNTNQRSVGNSNNKIKSCHSSLKNQPVNTTVSNGLTNDLGKHHVSQKNEPRMFTNWNM